MPLERGQPAVTAPAQAVDVTSIKNFLAARVPLFASLSPESLEHLAGSLQVRDLPAQTVLFREDELGDCLYIIMEGEIDIVKAMDTDDERLLASRAPGDFFGEMSLLEVDGRRTASVRTRTAARLLSMGRTDFERLLHRRPALGYAMLRSLSMRLREANEATIADLRAKNVRLAEAYEELRAAQAQIIEKEKLERELELARQIQTGILPVRLPQLPGYDLAARMVPARAVGGDLFDVIPLGPDAIGLVIADVSGKGVPAAIFMALTRSLVRAIARLSEPPAATLRRVNDLLLEMNSANMFVTALYGILQRKTGQFTYARAGHELPLLVDAHGEVTEPSFCPGLPLAMLPRGPIDECMVAIPPGGMLVLYTDGVSDALSAGGERFGYERLQAVAGAQAGRPAAEASESIWQAIAAYQGPVEQADDVTFLVVRAA